MKIGVLADSHDHLDNLRKAMAVFQKAGVKQVIHAGDFVAPFTLPVLGEAGVPVTGVFGNNDGERVGLSRGFARLGELHERPHELALNGRRIIVLHEPIALPELASAFDLVIYGHTHKVDVRQNLLNPGEVCGWVTGRTSVALVDLPKKGAPKIEIVDL